MAEGPVLGIGGLFNLEDSLDTTIFMVLALVGLALLVGSYVLGGAMDAAGDLGADIGGGDLAGDVVNLHTLSAFLTGFGSLGWLLSGYWGVPPILSALGGLAGGVPMAGLVIWIGTMLQRQSGSSNFSLEDLVGTEAVVTLRMAPGSVGYVEYARGGGTYRAIARPAHGEEIPIGTLVTVTRVVGNELLVTPRGDD
ncbi:MAG: NfeD family protein [Dehalococcoidia bacterium]